MVGACAEANNYIATSNNDAWSMFHTRTGPFLLDSFVFFVTALVQMGANIQDYE